MPLLKAREPRVNVFIPARMKLGARWTDAFILNVSSRGLMIRASEHLDRGAYIELRRADQVIVARVVWRAGSRAGLRSQDRLPVEAIVTGTVPAVAVVSSIGPANGERRKHRRDADHERSRYRGRAMEFTSLVLIGATSSAAIFSLVAETLERPLSSVQAALAGQASLPADSR
jgi:hypothetical protein